MRSNKILMSVLAVLFIAVAGMFYYSNFYTVQQQEKDLVDVYIAKKDISQGSLFTENNVGKVSMKKELVLEGYVTDFKKLKNLSAVSTIYKNEVLTQARVADKKTGEKLHVVSIIPLNEVQGLEEGDSVRVFAKPRFMSQVYELFEIKEVQAVNFKKQSSGEETALVQSIDLNVSDEEVEIYERALASGDISVVLYSDLSDVNTQEFLPYEEVAYLVEIGQDRAKMANKKIDYYYIGIHKVESGDTWESLASKYKHSIADLQLFNQTTTLKVDDVILVN